MFRRKPASVEVRRRQLRYAAVAYLDAGGDRDGALAVLMAAVVDQRMVKTFT